MPIVERDLALLRHPRLAALATSAWPAWLWSVDGSRLLWANAVGAAIFGGVGSTASTQRRFDVGDAFTAQIIRLAAMLPSGAHERFERLRGLGAGFGRALTCACSRIVLDDGTGAVLVAACEPAAAGPPHVARYRADAAAANERSAERAKRCRKNGTRGGRCLRARRCSAGAGARCDAGQYRTGTSCSKGRTDCRTAPSLALCLEHGCGRPLRHRLGRIHWAGRTANHDRRRPALERDCRGAESRSEQSSRAGGRDTRNMERHCRFVAGRRHRRTVAYRALRAAGVRSRPQLSRLSRLRRLP